jgi:DNA-binding beta-propeller fold protein YncE
MAIRSASLKSSLLVAVGWSVMLMGPKIPDASAGFEAGDILVTGYNMPGVQRYNSAGTLVQTITGAGSGPIGASLTPDGNLVITTTFNGISATAGVDIFNAGGSQIASFLTPAVGANVDIGVFANGVLAIPDHAYGTIQEYKQDGTFVRTVSVAGLYLSFGCTVGSDNILYVAGLNSEGGGSNSIARITQDGSVLASFNLGFHPSDLVRAADGTFYVAGYLDEPLFGIYHDVMVHHLSATGTDLNDFPIGSTDFFSGIALSADGQSLYVSTMHSSAIEQFSLSGTELSGGFALSSPSSPLFLTVVPGVIASVPEPSSVAMVIIGLGVSGWFAARRRVSQDR